MSGSGHRAVPNEDGAVAAVAAAAGVEPWNVLCDFDGTVTLDVTDSLLWRFARSGWEALELDWRAGSIGSRECMAGQVELLDCSREELDEHLARIAIDPCFALFAAAVPAAGGRIAIVSDGLDEVIRALLVRHGLHGIDVFASRLVQCGRRSWRLEFPHARPGCASATCKCARARSAAGEAERPVLLVGDGDSDVCVSGAADLVFARGRLLEHCRRANRPYRRTDDFFAVLREWDALLTGTAQARASRAIAHREEKADA